jgi:hypothetical protein
MTRLARYGCPRVVGWLQRAESGRFWCGLPASLEGAESL